MDLQIAAHAIVNLHGGAARHRGYRIDGRNVKKFRAAENFLPLKTRGQNLILVVAIGLFHCQKLTQRNKMTIRWWNGCWHRINFRVDISR